MKKSQIRLLLIVLISIPSIIFAQKFDVTTREVAPGIIYKHLTGKADTISANLLEIDLTNNNYKIESVEAGDSLSARAKVTEISKNFNGDVIAGINADFFLIKTGGEVTNNMISKGEFVKAITVKNPKKIRSQFAITKDNKPLIERFAFSGKLWTRDKKEFKVKRVNSKTDSSSITLYNHFQGEKTPAEKFNVSELSLNPIGKAGDTLIFIAHVEVHHSGENSIEDGNYVLSSSYQKAEDLFSHIKENDTIKVLLRLHPYYYNIYSSTGGFPRLVKNGKNIADSDSAEVTSHSFSVVKHPRTGIGFSHDSTKLYFITVDGRQESSSGMSLKEFADLMILQGIYQGINLDGGGSTTMVLNGEVVNNPSDKSGERAVGNALLLIKSK